MTYLWKKHLFKLLLTNSLLFIGLSFLLYSVLDYSIHSRLSCHSFSQLFCKFIPYYIALFVKSCDLIVSVSLLLATLKVWTSLSSHQEFLALQTSGLSWRKIGTPFLWVALLFSGLSYVGLEWGKPQAYARITDFEANYAHHRSAALYQIGLGQGSQLIYHRLDRDSQVIYDLFFLPSFPLKQGELFYHADRLDLDVTPPLGHLVDSFYCNSKGQICYHGSHMTEEFDRLRGASHLLKHPPRPYRALPLSQLLALAYHKNHSLPAPVNLQKQSNFDITLCLKLVQPSLPTLMMLALIPFCVYFTPRLPPFFLFALSLVGYLLLYGLIDAMQIISRATPLSPMLVLGSIPLMSLILGSYRWIKMM